MPTIYHVLLRRMRTPLIVLIILYAISILGFVLIPGQDDAGNARPMSFFEAFYFVSYMASTIGFGEIPYAFTAAQRFWVMPTLYATVIGWLYSIGSILAILQDPAFIRMRREYVFQRSVRRLRDPFYLVCGFGDTGAILVSALAAEGMRSVVIDLDENRIKDLEVQADMRQSLGLVADASKPAVLAGAGVMNPYCLGVIALTDSDRANLLIALSTHLLQPDLRLLARAETTEAVANIRSFGENEVINPFETFAARLEMALNTPSMYTLFEWLTGIPHQKLGEPVFPGKGHWVLAGYGRFGKALYRRMQAVGVSAHIIDANPFQRDAPQNTIVGEGTEAATLISAGIKEATGIVAGTNDDATNLSILMTARELNPELFMVARQNQRDNALIFDKAHFHLTMKRGDVIAHKIFALLRTPLISDCLELAVLQDEDWANQLLSRIVGITDDEVPYLWEIRITQSRAPALYDACMDDEKVILANLLADPHDRSDTLPVIPLLLKRRGKATLLPSGNTRLKTSDRLLMCARPEIEQKMLWATQNEKALHYLITGKESAGGLWWNTWLRSGMSKEDKD